MLITDIKQDLSVGRFSTMTVLSASLDSTPNPNLDPKQAAGREHLTQVQEADGAPHVVTPLIRSEVLSQKTGHNVYVKMDALQPSGSFKIRGVGAVCSKAVDEHGKDAHIVTSSGGNAGLAAATCAHGMGVRCTVFVPLSTEASVRKTLEGLGAKVMVHGASWDDADAAAREVVAKDEAAIYVHPFEGDVLERGHATLVDEIYSQGPEPDVIISATGGGGLLRGILHGLDRKGKTPRVFSVQCFGADSFNQSHEAGRPIKLNAITSKATSMGARLASSATLAAARDYPRLHTLTVSDGHAASAAWQFKRDHDVMVELSCGAALAPAYYPERFLGPLPDSPPLNIVLVACGGSKIDQEMLAGYERDFGSTYEGKARLDGNEI